MSLQIAFTNDYSASIRVVGIVNHAHLAVDSAVFVSADQLPLMNRGYGSYLVGKGVYMRFGDFAELNVFASNLAADWTFANAGNVINDEEGETNNIKLKVGQSIYFITARSVYKIDVERIYKSEERVDTRESKPVGTEELLAYVKYTFVDDFKATLPKPVNSDIPVENPMQDAVEQLMSEIDGLKVDIDSNLSIANDASINASAPEMEPNNTNVFAKLRRPEPILASSVAAPEVLIAAPRPSLSDSYVLDEAPEKIALAPSNSIIEREAAPNGLKAWKVNHISTPMQVKLTFDKLIPACKLRRVSCDALGNIRSADLSPIRRDGAYDCVYTTIKKGEYIYFTANGLYIDVKLTKVEYSDV